MRKLVFGVSNLVRHKPGCTVTEDDERLEISDLVSRGTVLSVKQKKGGHREADLCLFVFVYAKSRFSHDGAQVL